jgi:hypothetical protein
MATHIVTKVLVRPNTSTDWPWEDSGVDGYADIGGDVMTKTVSVSADGLTHTSVQTWASKEQLENLVINKNNSTFSSASATNRNYMAANNISGRSTAGDGTVTIFDSSSKAWVIQE